MSSYYFYTIGQNGHIKGPPLVFEAGSDADAIRQANKIVCSKEDIEIWLEARMVAYVTYATSRVA